MCVKVQYNNCTTCGLKATWNKGMIVLFDMCERVQYNNFTTCGLKAAWNKGMIVLFGMSGRVQYNNLACWGLKAQGATPRVIHPWNRGTELGMGHALLHL
jgi:hypothetical protein